MARNTNSGLKVKYLRLLFIKEKRTMEQQKNRTAIAFGDKKRLASKL
jgi:hypothetical protein